MDHPPICIFPSTEEDSRFGIVPGLRTSQVAPPSVETWVPSAALVARRLPSAEQAIEVQNFPRLPSAAHVAPESREAMMIVSEILSQATTVFPSAEHATDD